MSSKCEICETVVYRRILRGDKLVGVDCGCTRRPRQLADSTQSAFDIKFQHVNDEFGQPLHVHNLRELSAAEKRLGFQSVVMNADAQNFDDPPQQKRIDFASVHNWKFSNEQRARAMARR